MLVSLVPDATKIRWVKNLGAGSAGPGCVCPAVGTCEAWISLPRPPLPRSGHV